jgi:sulfite reductase alpha subunit-like flavoprotein
MHARSAHRDTHRNQDDCAYCNVQQLTSQAHGVLQQNAAVKATQSLPDLIGPDAFRCIKSITSTSSASDSELLPHIRRGSTLRQALLWSCDITTPPAKFVLAALAECCTDAREATTLRYLSSRVGREAYKADIAAGRPTLLQLLERYSSCQPTAEKLLALLPPLRPRLYSLTNSQSVSPDALEFAFHVVEFETHFGAHSGVATSWLERDLTAGAWCPVHLRPPTGFSPPQDAGTPVIMVGPGTGVAPFRGFLQHRAAAKAAGVALGESWLFFGNWRRDWDFLYEEELSAFADEGVLSHLHLAWSREPDSKVGRVSANCTCHPHT